MANADILSSNLVESMDVTNMASNTVLSIVPVDTCTMKDILNNTTESGIILLPEVPKLPQWTGIFANWSDEDGSNMMTLHHRKMAECTRAIARLRRMKEFDGKKVLMEDLNKTNGEIMLRCFSLSEAFNLPPFPYQRPPCPVNSVSTESSDSMADPKVGGPKEKVDDSSTPSSSAQAGAAKKRPNNTDEDGFTYVSGRKTAKATKAVPNSSPIDSQVLPGDSDVSLDGPSDGQATQIPWSKRPPPMFIKPFPQWETMIKRD